MTEREFIILRFFAENTEVVTQPDIAEKLNISSESVNMIISKLRSAELISDDCKVTKNGFKELEPYRVDNAIILAAGMSTRFVPFSYERPKGLTVVKGDVLIEHQIKQLLNAGVGEIVLVLGHMMEKFHYLVKKYGVKIVVNKDYRYKNTHSSIFYASEYLKNSYICCADNYFPESVFHCYEYHSLYSTLYMEGIWRGERGVTTDKNGLIIATQRPAVDQWVMNGFAYFSNSFSEKFKGIIENMWDTPGTENLYWEQVYAEHVAELPLYAVRYTDAEVMEFDSVAELEAFDPEYIKYNELAMTKNICKTLNCTLDDIHSIKPIQKGYTNKSFSFVCKDKKYIYRTPGAVSSAWIDRKSEKRALETAKKLHIDDSYIYENENEGWKISAFAEITEKFDFSKPTHLSLLCESLRKLYSEKIVCGRSMDYMAETRYLLSLLQKLDEESYAVAMENYDAFEQIDKRNKDDKWPVQLVHNDLYEDNLLISGDKLYIIDWEYAGDTDIGYDICKLIIKNNATGSDIDNWLSYFYGRKPTEEEKRHIVGCAAVSFYYWYVWVLYMVKKGNNCSDLILKYYNIADKYKTEFRLL